MESRNSDVKEHLLSLRGASQSITDDSPLLSRTSVQVTAFLARLQVEPAEERLMMMTNRSKFRYVCDTLRQTIFFWNVRRSQAYSTLVSVYFVSAIACILCLSASTAYAVYENDVTCDLIVPDDNDNCCTCVCNIQASWCRNETDSPSDNINLSWWSQVFQTARSTTTTRDMLPSVAPDNRGGFFTGNNSAQSDSTQYAYVGSSTAVAVSILSLLFQVYLANTHGNWYMLLCLSFVMACEVSRALFLHIDSYHLATGAVSSRLLVKLSFDALAGLSVVVCMICLRYLQSHFVTLQFQRFGEKIRHDTLRYYQVMFATAVMDWQSCTAFYIELAVLSSQNTPVLLSLAVFFATDQLSLYLGYHYARFEQRRDMIVAMICKAFLGGVWCVIIWNYYMCFSDFKSKALYLRSVLLGSRYLAVDVGSASEYLWGDCKLTSSVSQSAEAAVILANIMIALFFRVISLYYATLLVLQFGTDQVASLFFDVVAMKQRSVTLIRDTTDERVLGETMRTPNAS